MNFPCKHVLKIQLLKSVLTKIFLMFWLQIVAQAIWSNKTDLWENHRYLPFGKPLKRVLKRYRAVSCVMVCDGSNSCSVYTQGRAGGEG